MNLGKSDEEKAKEYDALLTEHITRYIKNKPDQVIIANDSILHIKPNDIIRRMNEMGYIAASISVFHGEDRIATAILFNRKPV